MSGTAPPRRQATWALVLVVVALVGCPRPERPLVHPRLVLLYATCTLNRAFLSPYDASVAYTPAIERLAREGVVFMRHQTESGQSGIAYASILSGSQATRHHVFRHPTRLSDDVGLVTEAFAAAGYETFFFGGHRMASAELNYAQGVPDINVVDHMLEAHDTRFEAMLARLRTDANYRAFVFTDFTVTHGRYETQYVGALCADVPAACRGVSADDIQKYGDLFKTQYVGLSWAFDATVAKLGLSPDDVAALDRVVSLIYASNVHRLDALFGDVVDRIRAYDLLEETAIVFTADHGELMDRPNARIRWNHGFTLAPEELTVPLIIRAPTIRPRRYEAVTRSIDVYPTLAGLAGVSTRSEEIEGADLSPALRAASDAPSELAFSHTTVLPEPMQGLVPFFPVVGGPFPRSDPELMWVALRDGDSMYSLVSDDGDTFRPEAYDLATDPAETTNRFDAARAVDAAAVARLVAYKKSLVTAYHAAAETNVPAERARTLLRSLGYIQ